MSAGRCPICGCRSGNSTHHATEMMFGMGGAFAYLECGDCGSLSLQGPPASMSPFYPPAYYSFDPPPPGGSAPGLVARAAMRAFLANETTARTTVNLSRLARRAVATWTRLLSGTGLTPESTVLDVGCGSGHRLRSLRRWGFRNLAGVDAYAPTDHQCGDDIAFWRSVTDDVAGRYDLVMYHHSLEHTPDPVSELRSARARLNPGGRVVVRVPLAGAFAWRRYRTDWVQLDAPRHLVVPTVGALHRMAEAAGLVVTRTAYDSDAFQFWGSEQYRQGIALVRSCAFSPEDIRAYARRATRLNAIGDGDQAAFLLRAA